MNTQDLIDALEAENYEWTDYSGRGMYGRHCVAVKINDITDLYDLGRDVGNIWDNAPRIDNLGKRFIVYWPNAKLGPPPE